MTDIDKISRKKFLSSCTTDIFELARFQSFKSISNLPYQYSNMLLYYIEIMLKSVVILLTVKLITEGIYRGSGHIFIL